MSDFEVFPRFGDGLGDLKANVMELGGKGANLSRMAAKGYPVPPGFTIPTAFCGIYQKTPKEVLTAVMTDMPAYLQWLESQFGFMPLLSVRSGAPVSMPGMMDTILNVGMTTKTIGAWKERIGERAAYDSYRRLLQMLGVTALGMDQKLFDAALQAAKEAYGAVTDQDMTADALRSACKRFYTVYAAYEMKVPDTLSEQLSTSINAVFRSWNSDRAKFYRAQEKIDGAMGTAVTVQTMVFGNFNDQSGSGVLFTRNPATGENVIVGEYLANAQGEDVVAGIRTPDKLEMNKKGFMENGWQEELRTFAVHLEDDAKDMQDIEFTVQDNKLWMLQTRNGKRTAKAAFRIAMDLLAEGLIEHKDLYSRVEAKHYVMASRPVIDPKFKEKPVLTGIPASPGVVTGVVMLDAASAITCKEPCILVTHETTPDDIAGMAASVGILTKTGGATSHAAVVARGMNKPCVVGCTEMSLGSPTHFYQGQTISIDGSTGKVWYDAVPVIDSSADPYVEAFFTLLYEDHGIIERTTEPRPNCCVTLADWCSRTDEQIEDYLETLSLLDEQGHQVILDVTDPVSFGDDTDKAVWNIAGSVPEHEIFWNRVIVPLLKIGGQPSDNIRFFASSPSIEAALIGAGFSVIKTITTVWEYMSTVGHVRMSQELEVALGPTLDSRNAMKAVLEKAGAKARLFKNPMYRGDAAFAVLRGA